MPQMAPMSWLLLFIYFIFLFFLLNSINFYMNLPTFNIKLNYKIQSKNWKW